MGKVKFTLEQMKLLGENKYTVKVTESTISFSREFKEIFYREYLAGALPREILEKYGYPAKVLGSVRICGIGCYIRREIEKNGLLIENRTKDQLGYSFDQTAEEKIRHLEHQVNYLTQEIEFLKKISLIKTPRK